MISFYEECMCPWENGKIVRHCTTGRIYKVYQAWCRENNHGYARTAKEFREQLAGYLGGTFADVTTRQKGNTYYKDFTITEETKELMPRNTDMRKQSSWPGSRGSSTGSSDFRYCYVKVSKHKALSILVAMGSRVFNFLD